jgi:hypothetical protein
MYNVLFVFLLLFSYKKANCLEVGSEKFIGNFCETCNKEKNIEIDQFLEKYTINKFICKKSNSFIQGNLEIFTIDCNFNNEIKQIDICCNDFECSFNE